MRFLMFQSALILSLASLLLMPLLFQVAVVQAVPETVVEVKPHTTSASVGGQITIDIMVGDVQNLYGVEVVLYWNSSVLEAKDIDIRLGETDGALYGGPLIVENSTQDGEYVLAATSEAPASSFNGNGSLVKITFRVVNSGNSELDLETQLYDYPPPDREPRISLPIDHTTVDGFFMIDLQQPEPLPTLIIAAIVTAVLVGVAVLIYFMKVKKKDVKIKQ